MQTLVSRGPSTRGSLGRHFYQFYKGREDLFRIAIPFLHLGLENKEACLWVVSRSVGILEAVAAFQRQCDLTRFIETGQLLFLPAERWYLDRGRFSEARVFEKMRKFVEEKRRSGFSSYRKLGDLGWLDLPDWLKFQSYEERTHEWFRTLRILAVCAYPIQNCSPTQAKDILEHHDGVFLTKL